MFLGPGVLASSGLLTSSRGGFLNSYGVDWQGIGNQTYVRLRMRPSASLSTLRPKLNQEPQGRTDILCFCSLGENTSALDCSKRYNSGSLVAGIPDAE